MLAGWTAKLGRGPRRPLAGTALAAIAGILLAEGWRTRFAADEGDPAWAAWVASALFLFLTAGWAWRRNGACLWGGVAAGFATLHLFAADPVPAVTLARLLASPAGALATGNDPTHATAHVLHAVGTVQDVPRLLPPPPIPPSRQAGATWRFVLRLEDAGVEGSRWPCHAAVQVTWRDASPNLLPGDRLEITALAENLAPPRNPGEFDRAARLRHEGILSTATASGVTDVRFLPPPPNWHPFSLAPWRRLAGHVHHWMERTLRADLDDDPEAGALVTTTLLGLANPPGLGDLEPVFQRTGTLHYFAVDGLKLGLISLLFLRALVSLGVPRPWPGLLIWPLILTYAFATGLGAASIRAVIFAGVLVGGDLVDRRAPPLNGLGAAAVILLALNPQQLFDLGFQLTFAVMLAILLVMQPLLDRLLRFGAPDAFLPRPLYSKALQSREYFRHRVCELTAVSVAAWLGSLPLMFGTFHLFSPISLVANVVTFPLAFAVLAVGVLSLAVSGVSTMASLWFNNANWALSKAFLFLVRASDAVPGGSFAVPSPPHWHWSAPAAELVVYDFDRGRAASLRAGGTDWLVDAARPSEYAQGVLPALRAHAIERLDGGLLLTQADANHLAAARLALTDLHPARIVESALANRSPLERDFRKFLAAQGRAETLCHRGDVLPLGDGGEVTILYPPADLSGKFRSAADRALAIQLHAAGWRVLMLTEGSGAAARWLAGHEAPETLRGEVLITSTPVLPELLAAVQPRLVVLRAPIVKEATDGFTTTPPPEQTSFSSAIPTFAQRESGAVSLLFYPDHLEIGGFVDKRKLVLQK